MISYQINDMVYATNDDLSGFFARRESSGAYTQQRGNSQIGFKNEKEFQKFCRAWHVTYPDNDFSRTPDVTSGGNFVWRNSW